MGEVTINLGVNMLPYLCQAFAYIYLLVFIVFGIQEAIEDYKNDAVRDTLRNFPITPGWE